VNLGLVAEAPARIDIPRYRYAIINYPHPLLESGLTILDTPGHNTMGAEPELTVHRIPDAAAIVFMLGADTGVTRTDRELWSEHIEPIRGIEQNCYVVLNKIDGLRDGFKPETRCSRDRPDGEDQRRGAARPPTRVFALSPSRAWSARSPTTATCSSGAGFYRLEQALGRGMVHQRRLDHASTIRAETRTALAESRALLDSRLGFAHEQLEEIAALQGATRSWWRRCRARRPRAPAHRAGARGDDGLRARCTTATATSSRAPRSQHPSRARHQDAHGGAGEQVLERHRRGARRVLPPVARAHAARGAS
jgi:hypothetical protein